MSWKNRIKSGLRALRKTAGLDAPPGNGDSLYLLEVEQYLEQVSAMTGSCSGVYLVIETEEEDHQSCRLAYVGAAHIEESLDICSAFSAHSASSKRSDCEQAFERGALAAVRPPEGDAVAPNCPAARQSFITEVRSVTDHPVWVVAVAGLLHPADIYTADVLAARLKSEEEVASELAASVPIPWTIRGQHAEDVIRSLVGSAAELARQTLKARRLLPEDAEQRALLVEHGQLQQQINNLEIQLDQQRLHLVSLIHEMRAPMNSVIGHLDLLKMGIHGEITDHQGEILDNIRSHTEQLLNLIKNILNHARIESGSMPLSRSSFRPADVIEELYNQIQPQATNKGLDVVLDFQDGTDNLDVYSSRQYVEQVVMNLLTNAVKFTEEGSITITATQPSRDSFEITVADTGCGVPEDELAAIFEPYRRTDREPRVTGAGLGLAICHSLVEQMGGILDVKSRLGEGSIFTLRLPIRDGDKGGQP